MTGPATILRPVAEPRIIENAYTQDQHRRMLDIVRRDGPWQLILAQHFDSPEAVLASVSGAMPEGMKPTWDMFLTSVYRGYFAKGGVALYPEIEDCFLNTKFLDLVRGYWGAKYAKPETMVFNIQGPCRGGSSPHIDATRYRGITMENTPAWVMNIMVKSGLFTRWRAKKAQVISWYYQGRVGGGFHYWPDGPQGQPKQCKGTRGFRVDVRRDYAGTSGAWRDKIGGFLPFVKGAPKNWRFDPVSKVGGRLDSVWTRAFGVTAF